ncbi:hypothetical protein ACZ90_56755 [Streptomyces albus subsp. albus]|nr:hypothetical protein ACZ90_56755 [Streptomyces albus subsp. albus]
MGQGRILTRGTRAFGALVCAALGLLSAAWIIRDLDKADETSHLWWTWSGLTRGPWGGIYGSGLVDLMLLVLCVFTGATALRSPAAAGALATLGVVTVALRLPALWTVEADWLDMLRISDGVRTRAVLTGWAGVLLGIALLVAVAVGRRPAGAAAPGYTPPGHPAPLADEPPTVPTPGAGALAMLFLGGAAGVIGAWQIYWAQEWGWDVYKHLLSGERVFTTLLAPPPAWAAWSLILLTLGAAVAAGKRTDYARPLGMTAATLVLIDGISSTSVFFKVEFVQHFDDLPTRETLNVLSAFFEVLAGLVALTALAQRGLRPGESWPGSGWAAPAAPWYGAAPAGYGPPSAPSGYGPSGGGYAPGPVPPPPSTPPPGTPPPPSSPPPGW